MHDLHFLLSNSLCDREEKLTCKVSLKDNHYCRLRDSIRSHFNPHYLFITDFIYEKITPVEEMQSKTEGSQAEIIWQGINL